MSPVSLSRAELLAPGKDGGSNRPELCAKYDLSLVTYGVMSRAAVLLEQLDRINPDNGKQAIALLRDTLKALITEHTGVR